MKFTKILILLLLLTACKSNKQIVNNNKLDKQPLLVNDSVAKFVLIDKKIAGKVENNTSYINPISKHFRKYITPSALQSVEFKEWKRKIYIEFSINKEKQVTYLDTNTASITLDKQLKKAFSKLDFNLFEFPEYDPYYKYTLVIIQEDTKGEPVIRCSKKAIGYTPPVFDFCKNEESYQALNNCNYMYITSYMHDKIDISLVTKADIENNHEIFPKFIIDENGKVIAAKIESQNKALIENYYKNIKLLPKAIKPAKINGESFYFGYTFPSTIKDLIRNNEGFKAYYFYEKSNGKTLNENIQAYIQILVRSKERAKIQRVGF